MVLDSSFYGAVTIDRSINIIAPDGVTAGVFIPANGSGITVAGTSGLEVVRLKNLHITTTNSNTNGILVGICKRVEIINCDIDNVTNGIVLTHDVRAYLRDVRVSEFSQYGIWSDGSASATSNMKIFGIGVQLIYGSTGIRIEGGSARMTTQDAQRNVMAFVNTSYSIAATVSTCTDVSFGGQNSVFDGSPVDNRDGNANIYAPCAAQ